MKVVNENLELVDYEEPTDSEDIRSKKVTKKLELAQRKLAINMLLIDLTYDLNKNLHHKMNLTIVSFQLGILLISLLIRCIFGISTVSISIITAFGSFTLMFLILIGNIQSEKALRHAKKQRDQIHENLEVLYKGSSEEDNYDK